MDTPATIVARFLRANDYNETLEIFLQEAGLPKDAGNLEKGDLTIEKILDEKRIFDLSLNFERIGPEGYQGWTLNNPVVPLMITTLPTASNILHVSVGKLRQSQTTLTQVLLATTADRRLNVLDTNQTSFSLVELQSRVADSPILSCVVLDGRYVITAGMSGQLLLFDSIKKLELDQRRDHSKYIVKIASFEDHDGTWLATIGWDAKILIYRLRRDTESINPPVGLAVLPSNPESVLFVSHPKSKDPMIVVTRRDSTFLYYYGLPQTISILSSKPEILVSLGKQNLAPYSNAWVAFTPCSIALNPTDHSILAVATSSLPHMKLIIVRLLLPPISDAVSGQFATHAAQAREELALQDREDAAVLINVSTMAPQTAYSTPQLCWRPDGSGVWVNGDDGIIRGIETKTGKVKMLLGDGHEPGSKVRSLWAGLVDTGASKEEWLISGGFDRRLIVWRPEPPVASAIRRDARVIA